MILDKLEQINFNIIFITAFDEYSVKALNYSGIPCLFKPVDIEELVEIVNKVSKNNVLETATKYEYADHLLKSKFSKIPVLHENGLNILDLKEISSLEGDKTNVKIRMENGDTINSKRSMHKFKAILPSEWFYFVKENLTVNLLQVNVPPERFRKRIVMKNGDKFNIEKSLNKDFWELYKKIP